MDVIETLNLAHGFLPPHDPLDSLPDEYRAWEDFSSELPKFLVAESVAKQLQGLPLLSTASLTNPEEIERAMLLLSFMGHAYVWGASKIPERIPEVIAIPWFELAAKLQRPPILSYASYALHNWRRLDPGKEVALGNIVLLQNFLGGIDEEWFVLVHIEIENEAAEGLKLFAPLQDAIESKEMDLTIRYLEVIAKALSNMCQTLDRMPEHCDPYIYYNRVRPYIHGWKDNPVLPQGIIYEGVEFYQNQPQLFRGETGAQSSIVPSFDALLGVQHENDPLRAYLNEMRSYMPVAHRAFIETIEKRGAIRDFIVKYSSENDELRVLYNSCVESLSRFRQTHLRYAAHYIQKQNQSSLANPTAVGTGGTPFMEYLRKHKDETLKYLI